VTATLLLALMISHSEPPAVSWFLAGVEERRNADVARKSFRQAAELLEAAPGFEHAKARARALSGDTPDAIRHLHRGLKRAPYDREMQADLRALRETIRYPDSTDPKLRVRPDGFDAIRHRFAPRELFVVAGAFGLMGVAGLVRHRSTRSTASRAVVAVGAMGFLFAFALSRWAAVEAPIPSVLAKSTTLRTGNGASYPAKLAEPLPAGAELKELTRRGGWVQVELPGGAAGWLPESVLLD
jgi:hypothetical protein